MTQSTIARLAGAEFDFVRVDAALSDLADNLHACASDCDAAGQSAMSLRKMRRQLRQVLFTLDKDITAAVIAFEEETVEAPF